MSIASRDGPVYISSSSSSALFYSNRRKTDSVDNGHSVNSLTSETQDKADPSGRHTAVHSSSLYSFKSQLDVEDESGGNEPDFHINVDSDSEFVKPELPTFQDARSKIVISLSGTFTPSPTPTRRRGGEDADLRHHDFMVAEEQYDELLWNEELDQEDFGSVFQDRASSPKYILRSPRKPVEKKVEIPLLETDVESDLRRMINLDFQKQPQIRKPRGIVRWEDDGKGLGGFGWSKKVVEQVRQTRKDIEEDAKLDTESGDEYLRKLIELIEEEEGLQRLYELESRILGERGLRNKITSPLSPAFSDIEEQVEEDDVDEMIDLEMLSSGPDLEDMDLEMIEKSFAKQDTLISSEPANEPQALGKVYSPLEMLLESSQGHQQHTPPDFNLQVEVPLTSDFLNPLADEMEEADVFSLLRGQRMISVEEKSTQNDSDELVRLLRPLTEDLLLNIEHETLTTADSASRVLVPAMDFVRPTVPWNKAEKEPAAQLQVLLESICINSTEVVWRESPAKEKQMSWKPFPAKLAKVSFTESIHDDSITNDIFSMLESDEGLVATERLIFDIKDSQIPKRYIDERLDPMDFVNEGEDMNRLIIEKQMELVKPLHIKENDKGLNHQYGNGRQVLPQTSKRITQKRSPDSLNHEEIYETLDFESFFEIDALNRFLALSKVSPSKRRKISSIEEPHQQTERPDLSPEPKIIEPPLISSLPLPNPLPVRCLFISATIFQSRRSLFRRLEQVYPAATFIERDFCTLYTIPELQDLDNKQQDKQTAEPKFDPTAEADILLSPATGLLITTLQRIQQTSLPGQAPDLNAFRQRLAQVSARHERIIVLVSQGCDMRAPDARQSTDHLVLPPAKEFRNALPRLTAVQTAAFASLCAYASNLKAAVLVHFVPAGEDELASWIARQMVQFGVDMTLRNEETIWEQVLRRAGLNTFAACCILTELKRSELLPPSSQSTATVREDKLGFGLSVGIIREAATSSLDKTSDEVFGLESFVKMTPDERVARFAKTMGGKRILGRVSECLAKDWTGETTDIKRKEQKAIAMDKKSKFF